MLNAKDIRDRLSFDVGRLRAAGNRMERVDEALRRLKKQLEERAGVLSGEALGRGKPELAGDGLVHLRYAQAHATAELARRAALGEVLQHSGRLALIACMAVSRWIWALRTLEEPGVPVLVVKGHIDWGRLAHRMLVTLSPKEQLRSGCGQLASAVVVAEFAHEAHAGYVVEQIEEGLDRGRSARGVQDEADAVSAASRALRVSADLLERMLETAEPAARDLALEAETVETAIEAALSGRG